MLGFLKRVGAGLLAKNASNSLRGDLSGALVSQDAHARFQEAVLAGNVYIGANPLGTLVTTQAGLSATTPALTLFNPFNSTVNLVIWSFGVHISAAPAAACGIVLATNLPNVAGVPTAPLTVTNANISNALLGQGQTGTSTAILTASGNQGQCYRVCTLNAAPIAVRYCFGTSGAAAIGGMSFRDAVDGALILPPGMAVSVQTSSAAAVACDFIWEEIPFNQ